LVLASRTSQSKASGEALALDWGDIDFRTGMVGVRRGKGGKARVTYVGAKTHRALLCWGGGQRRSAIFPLTPSGGATLMTRFSRKSGVHITFHKCRRTSRRPPTAAGST